MRHAVRFALLWLVGASLLRLLLSIPVVMAQIVPDYEDKTHLGRQPGIINHNSGACATSSRTFDGATQYFTNANGSHATLEAAVGQDVAVELWVYPNVFSGTYSVFYQGGDSTARPGVRMRFNATGLYFYAADADGSVTTSGPHGLAAGQWFMLSALCDRDADAQGWVNGGANIDATPGACPDKTFANTTVLSVGANYTGTEPLNGRMAVVAVWIAADLSGWAAGRVARYNSGVPLSCAVLQATYGATACWGMNEAAGANEDDEIGAVDLTQVNSPGSADGPGPGCN